VESSLSRRDRDESRCIKGFETIRGVEEVDDDNWSREGAFRRRGLTMLSLDGWRRFSLEGGVRTQARGTGSLEGRGIPEGRVGLVEGFMIAMVLADNRSEFSS